MTEPEDYDFLLSPEVLDRHAHSEELARALLDDSAKDVKAIGATTHATLSGFGRVVTFSAMVPKPVQPVMSRWKFRLADYLYNARALLDNLMWFAAHDNPLEPLTEGEEKGLQFPIAATGHEWSSFTGRPEAKKIRPAVMERIREVQPFLRPDHPTSRGMSFMNRIHRYDKHRVPLTLSLRLDMQMLPPYGVEAVDGGWYEHTEEWLGWDQPLTDGLPLTRRTFSRPVKAPEDRELSATMMASFEGDDYDLQDLMWDVQAGLLRAIDSVHSGMHVRADIFEGAVEWRRESLEALKRSITNHTDEWSARGFDKPSPWSGIIDEMNKPTPDLSRFLRRTEDADGRTVWIGKDHPFHQS